MHRDPTLRKRNAMVIPGVLLTLFSLDGMLYTAFLRPDTVECGDGGLVVFAYACRRAALLLVAPLVLGLALTIWGAMVKSKSTCHLGHGTIATTGLAVLIAAVVLPLAATVGLWAMEDPAAPFIFTYDGVEYDQISLLGMLTVAMALALIPYLALYIGTARPAACCRDNKCFEPCFCDEAPVQAPVDDRAAGTVAPPAAPVAAPVALMMPQARPPSPAPVTRVQPAWPQPAAAPAPPVRPLPVPEPSTMDEAMDDASEPEEWGAPDTEPEAVPKAAAAKAKPAAKGKLTEKQLAQRKYAGSMGGIRKRAKKASGGKGPIAKRSSATKLRRELGLKGK